MTLQPVNLVHIALIAIAGLGVLLTVSQPRLRAVSALMAMSCTWMIFNVLEETAGFRDIWLVTPAFRLAYPPLVYLTVRGIMIAGPALTWRDWPHAVPFLIALALTTQIAWVEHAARISLFVYSAAAIWLIHRFRRATRETRSDAQAIQLNGLYALIGFYVVDGVFDVLRMDAHWVHPYWPWLETQTAYLFQISVSLVFVVVLILIAVRHSRLFEGLEPGALDAPRDEPATPAPGDAAAEAEDFRRIDEVVRGEALYSEPRLTRTEVAAAAGLGERAVSRAIKTATGRNFNDYINSLRIEDVCAMMQEDARAGTAQRVIDLAFTAGFSSKSVFNAVFKRETGETPSAYAARLREGEGRPVSGIRSA
tara:strand:- start:1546 stop:2643 length:1098 start_codon:yes stop_codon:yes gene_type:complete